MRRFAGDALEPRESPGSPTLAGCQHARALLRVPAGVVLLLAVFAVLSGERHGVAPVRAQTNTVTYPAGWSLVSGPRGSTLVGAADTIYTWQAGDQDYEALPASQPLEGCRGYWAYFPSGGSINLAPGSGRCAVFVSSEQWVMVGNPSDAYPAQIEIGSPGVALEYRPDLAALGVNSGYRQTRSIPVGYGVWVQASANIVVTAVPPSAAPSPQTVAQLGGLGTTAGLQAVALNAADVPGFTPATQPAISPGANPWLATYSAAWSGQIGNAAVTVADFLGTAPSAGAASLALASLVRGATASAARGTVQTLSVSGVGDEIQAISYPIQGQGTQTSGITDAIVFRRGPIVAEVAVSGAPNVISPDEALALAQIIDARVQAALAVPGALPAAVVTTSPTQTPTAPPSPQPPPCVGTQGVTSANVTDCLPNSAALPTGRCWDGTWVIGAADQACIGHFGVEYFLPNIGSHLFQASGSGETDTGSFTAPSGVLNICYSLSGQSAGGLSGPAFGFAVEKSPGTPEYVTPGVLYSSGCTVAHLIDGAGTYYLEILATSWTNWTITVDAAGVNPPLGGGSAAPSSVPGEVSPVAPVSPGGGSGGSGGCGSRGGPGYRLPNGQCA